MPRPQGKNNRGSLIRAHPDFIRLLKDVGGDVIDNTTKTKLMAEELRRMDFKINVTLTSKQKRNRGGFVV